MPHAYVAALRKCSTRPCAKQLLQLLSCTANPTLLLPPLLRHAGKPDILPAGFWAAAAAQVPMRQQQLQQLDASWSLFDRAVARLNEERQQLRLQLQRAIDSPAIAAAAAAAEGKMESSSSSGSNGCAAAQGMAGCLLAAAAEVPGCFGVQRLCYGCMDLADSETLADSVERNLMRGRAIIMAFGEWQMRVFVCVFACVVC